MLFKRMLKGAALTSTVAPPTAAGLWQVQTEHPISFKIISKDLLPKYS